MNHPHSYAHINELGYQAVRRAILPSYPRPRSGDGRFLNRIETKARDLRAELQCQSNQTLSEAIEELRAASEPQALAGNRLAVWEPARHGSEA